MTVTRILLTSLATSAHGEFSMSILNLNVNRALEMSIIFGIHWLQIMITVTYVRIKSIDIPAPNFFDCNVLKRIRIAYINHITQDLVKIFKMGQIN